MTSPESRSTLAQQLRALLAKATPGPWQTRFLWRTCEAARKDPSLLFVSPPAQDWPDCELVEFLVNHANEFAALLTSGTPEPAPATCAWTYDDIDDKWDTSCGHAHCFTCEGDAMPTPEAHQHAFCPYCGQTLAVSSPPDQEQP
jgi:hypothetical protein